MQFKLNDPVCVVEFGKPTVYGKIAGVYVSEGEPSGYKVEVATDGDGLPSFIHASASHIVPTGALNFPVTVGAPYYVPATEKDPNGVHQHTPGAKLDAGKVRPDLILSGMPRALLAVAEVGTFGAAKYTENGWMGVSEGVKRYTAAMDRHRLRERLEPVDKDSGLTHQAHLAWNALARLELMLIELEEKQNG